MVRISVEKTKLLKVTEGEGGLVTVYSCRSRLKYHMERGVLTCQPHPVSQCTWVHALCCVIYAAILPETLHRLSYSKQCIGDITLHTCFIIRVYT